MFICYVVCELCAFDNVNIESNHKSEWMIRKSKRKIKNKKLKSKNKKLDFYFLLISFKFFRLELKFKSFCDVRKKKRKR